MGASSLHQMSDLDAVLKSPGRNRPPEMSKAEEDRLVAEFDAACRPGSRFPRPTSRLPSPFSTTPDPAAWGC
jgi:hypothetical protein